LGLRALLQTTIHIYKVNNLFNHFNLRIKERDTMKAGFAEIDITPPIGTHKIGWIIDIISEQVLDPLFARAAAFVSDGQKIGFIGLDTLSIRWTTTQEIRRRISERFGFPGEHVMVAASHNHAGPVTCNCFEVKRDEAYLETLIERCVAAFGQALERLTEAEIGFGHTYEWEVAHNRRVVMRDGTARCHGTFADPDALYLEGPIDPEVAVLAARSASGELLGCLVNFTCHPTHHGGDTCLTANYPGALAREMKARGCPVTVFLNGACGNIHHSDPVQNGGGMDYLQIGAKLAQDAASVLASMAFSGEMPFGVSKTTVQLPYRAVTEDEVNGTMRGAQRFIIPEIYDKLIPGLLERIRLRGTQPAEVQALSIGNVSFVSIPAEYFVEHGLRIKTESYPRHALVVGHANGMVGYVPTKEAFTRGGYETTFSPGHRMAPEAGDILADAAISLLKEGAPA